ncbi:MAG: T9SS type A sorting domain-containing protein [candidate division Zixibacteria bacterium]|nr:T9SS type A sorting domain-containing protein [candidate division Zixibacteria bacterium]
MKRLLLHILPWAGALLIPMSVIGRTFVAVTRSDTHDSNPGDGICRDLSGKCSLRGAIEEANAGAFDTVLVADSTGTIYLTLGPLVITGSGVTIAGEQSPAVIDGRYNPVNCDNIEVRGAGCRIFNCEITHARRNGVLVAARDATLGQIGYRTIFTGNGGGDPSSSAIAIKGPTSSGTAVTACWIGLGGNGTTVDPNRNGIRVCGADSITIGANSFAGRNLISGNAGSGVLVDSLSSDVGIIGNYIGLDITGRSAAGNGGDGIRIVGGSRSNRVGGSSVNARNLIAANLGCGIRLEGVGTDSNQIGGNLIGLDSAGYLSLGNHLAGVRVAAGAKHNTIGHDSSGTGMHLVVAGSRQNGIEILGAGTDSNRIDWAWIGLDGGGNGDRPNGLVEGQGILISGGAKHNIVGRESSVVRNVISGNYGPGITIAGWGTDNNLVVGNYIGPSRQGSSTIGNSAGVVIRDSARYNQIGTQAYGNLISGNRWEMFPLGAGVVLYGRRTDFNSVRKNFIGVDYTGTRAIRNGAAGIVLGNGASHNTIGGDTTVGNLISGNGTPPLLAGLAAGIHLFGPGTDSNVIAGNLIGVAADGQTPIPNTGHGIGVFGGARWTSIGGDSPATRNTIARNKYAGIWIDGDSTYGHVVRYNSVFGNDSTGMALRNGGNLKIAAPVILAIGADTVFGSHPIPGAVIDIYKGRTGSKGHIEGASYLAGGVAGVSGGFEIVIPGLHAGDTVTATATVAGMGSSEFATGLAVPVPTDVDEAGEAVPSTITLRQNTPNPFNPNTLISFALPYRNKVTLEIINALGERVLVLADREFPAGQQAIMWDGRNADGASVASGVYFYRLTTSGTSITRKMLLLK